jgi:hypothetical protein
VRFPLVLSLVAFLLLAVALPACDGDIVVGPGDSCTHEGWFGPDRVCPPGYICNDMASWSCTKPSYGSEYPPSSRPLPVDGAPPTSEADGGAEDDAASSRDASFEDDASDASTMNDW